ncbi:MAG: Xaa-Pro peptidase family protein [Nanoarchaeota archaeon]|nr:Xaa-Pro peptidase family protein [Nanoarchaeota archaeon]
MNNRIIKLKKRLEKEDIVIIYNESSNPNPNFQYFSSYTNVSGYLIIPKKKPAFILTNTRDYEQAKKSGLNTYLITKEQKKNSSFVLKEMLQKKRIKFQNIGIDKENFRLLAFEKLKKELKGRYSDVSVICKQLRAIKDEEEIKSLRKTCKITDMVFSKLVNKFKFRTERQVKYFIESEIRKQGAELSFPTIAASGKNSSIPHYDDEQKLKKGFLILDFGARVNGYHSDMTRTLYLGKPSSKDRFFYDLVLKNQVSCLDEMEEGKRCSDIYDYSNKLFGDYKDFFIHNLGHGVGLQIHEYPNLAADVEDVFLEGMTFTVEPGIYFEGKFGIRIEDTVILRKGRAERLTRSQKELIIIDKN